MGGAVSTGQDNDDLIDNLVEADYIRTHLVAKVFRAVDRAEYFLPDSRANAYKDLAWKSGNLHLSAPCIYSEVMEGLCLQPALSFLNLGSGTGYLSTMAGLILGSNGVNHGIEIHADVIQYACKKLDDFKRYSGAIDEYDFCEPKFVQGNCLCLSSGTQQYDRVYCGAACPEPHENYMKNLLKVGGILVMPLNDQLLQVKRTTETSWDVRTLLPVSFATLIQPPTGRHDYVTMMDVEPLTLQAWCRMVVRNILRKNIDHEYPNLKSEPTTKKVPKRKRALRRLVVPLFDSSDESSEDEHHVRNRRSRDFGRVNLDNGGNDNNNQNRDVNTLIDFVLGRLRERRNNAESVRPSFQEQEVTESSDGERTEASKREETTNDEIEEENVQSSNEEVMNVKPEVSHKIIGCESKLADERMEVDSAEGTSTSRQVQAVIEHPQEPENANYEPYLGEGIINGIQEVIVGVLHELRGERAQEENDDGINENSNEEQDNVNVEATASTSEDCKQAINENKPKPKREKFDSGIGDEIEKDTISSDTDLENVMEIDSCSSSDENPDDRPSKRGQRAHSEIRTGGKWRRITLSNHRFDNVSSSETETGQDEVKINSNEIRTLASPYTALMKSKIQELPLPPVLKNYLNFYREF